MPPKVVLSEVAKSLARMVAPFHEVEFANTPKAEFVTKCTDAARIDVLEVKRKLYDKSIPFVLKTMYTKQGGTEPKPGERGSGTHKDKREKVPRDAPRREAPRRDEDRKPWIVPERRISVSRRNGRDLDHGLGDGRHL